MFDVCPEMNVLLNLFQYPWTTKFGVWSLEFDTEIECHAELVSASLYYKVLSLEFGV